MLAQTHGALPGCGTGSVSPFGLLNDTENHVVLFLEEGLKNVAEISFHPNDNRYTVVISQKDFRRYLDLVGNPYVFLDMDQPELPE